MSAAQRPDDVMAMMALGLLDLRAQYQAALRILSHAEQSLLRCRTVVSDATAFPGCLTRLRDEVASLSSTNKSVRDLLAQLTREVESLK